MKTKPYPQTEEKPTVANEPAVAYGMAVPPMNVYQVTDAERDSILRAKEQYARGEYYTESEMEVIMKSKEEFRQGLFYTQEEVDEMVEEWLS